MSSWENEQDGQPENARRGWAQWAPGELPAALLNMSFLDEHK